jgi:hypothetical protein
VRSNLRVALQTAPLKHLLGALDLKFTRVPLGVKVGALDQLCAPTSRGC